MAAGAAALAGRARRPFPVRANHEARRIDVQVRDLDGLFDQSDAFAEAMVGAICELRPELRRHFERPARTPGPDRRPDGSA